MNEKDMTTLFGGYIKKNPPKESEAYELKFTSGKSLSFKEVKIHQIKALLEVEKGGLYHRITDQPWIKDRPHSYTLKKPFDCFCMNNAKAYVVIWFYKPRKSKRFLKMRIKDFLMQYELSTRKSLTEKKALTISTVLNIK